MRRSTKLFAVLVGLSFSSAVFARGACVYYQPYPKAKCDVTSAQNCRIVNGKYFAGKTCKQVRNENSSAANVSVPQLGLAIRNAIQFGKSTGVAYFSARDVFHASSAAAGTQVTFNGQATFELTRVSLNLFKVRSLKTKLQPLQLFQKKMPLHLVHKARELFYGLSFSQFSFTGTLRLVGGRAYVRLNQLKEFVVEGVEEAGQVVSSSHAVFGLGTSNFVLRTKGDTFHSQLVDYSAVIVPFQPVEIE